MTYDKLIARRKEATYASMRPEDFLTAVRLANLDGPVPLNEALVLSPSLLTALSGVPDSVVAAVDDWASQIDRIAVPVDEQTAVKDAAKNRRTLEDVWGITLGWTTKGRLFQADGVIAGLSRAEMKTEAAIREVKAVGELIWNANQRVELDAQQTLGRVQPRTDAIVERLDAGDSPVTVVFWENVLALDAVKSEARLNG